MAMQIVVPGLLPGAIDDVARVALGTTVQDELGAEYIYLQGIADTLVGDLVVYDVAYLTTRGVIASTGPAAFATAAVLVDQFGWYQIRGDVTGNGAAAFATANAPVGRGAVAGEVAAQGAGNTVLGVYVLAVTAAAGPVTLRIVHPPHIIGAAA